MPKNLGKRSSQTAKKSRNMQRTGAKKRKSGGRAGAKKYRPAWKDAVGLVDFLLCRN